MSNADNFVSFLNKSHSVFHAIEQVEHQLQDAGFLRLKENTAWDLENNRFYYVVRNQSCLIAFKIPEMEDVRSINIVASHSDSPALKVKPVAPLANNDYSRLNVEVYGGAILPTWLDRPLSVAGRVTVKSGDQLISRLVDLDEETFMIPNVAIHQNREINNGYKYNPQVDMLPMMCADNDPEHLDKLICSKLAVEKKDIYGSDLFMYNKMPAIRWGEKGEFVSGQRIDNLESVFTSLQALKDSYSSNSISMMTIFDNEEIGSMTSNGMATTFLADVINRIFSEFGYGQQQIRTVLANSFLLSADNGHAVHPNHPELYDETNRVRMNRGVVFKTSANQSYISESASEAVLKHLAEKAEVPYQFFANRSDMRGGATQTSLGVLNLPIMAADIGLAQLAMHSCYETCGSQDIDYMIEFMKAFYGTSLSVDNGSISLQ